MSATPLSHAVSVAGDPILEHVVLDSGAIISGISLTGLAKNYWTIGEVVAEIRDEHARERLKTFPFEIKSRQPSEDAVSRVVDFAKKTGDLRELSRTDVLVLALTYQLEVECNGASHLHTEPASIPLDLLDVLEDGVEESKDGPDGTVSNNGEDVTPGSTGVSTGVPGADEKDTHMDASVDGTGEVDGEHGSGEEGNDVAAGDDGDDGDGWTEVRHEKREGGSKKKRKNKKKRSAGSVPVPSPPPKGPSVSEGIPTPGCTEEAKGTEDAPVDDGCGEWFGPESLRGDRGFTGSKPGAKRVGCITTDFAMQNVLLQMGLHLLSLAGRAVKSVKQWVLKCDSCYTITTKMDKLFCGKCGNPTLARLGVTLSARGQPILHYKKGRHVNLRGSKFPLPKPKGGRDGDLLLREDQLLTGVWRQHVQKKEVKPTMFADCNIADLVSPKVAVGSQVVVGYGKRNPNAAKGRERRGKTKTKKT